MKIKTAAVIIVVLASLCFAAEEKVVFTIDGMTCNGCVNKITTSLKKVDGIKSVDVTLKPGKATVLYASEKTDPEVIMKTIASMGYKVKADHAVVSNTANTNTKTKQVKAKPFSITNKQTSAQKTSKGCSKKCSASSACKVNETAMKCGSHSKDATTAKSMSSASSELTAKDDHFCPTLHKSTALIEFHKAMHPLHKALNNGDYQKIRDGFTALSSNIETVKQMKYDASFKANPKEFEKKRKELAKRVKKLGKAVKDSDDKRLVKEFDKMHEAYIALGSICN